MNLDQTTSSKYVIKLDEPLLNVKEIRLRSTEIPNVQYTVNTLNNVLQIIDTTDSNTEYTLEIPPGNYNGYEMQKALEVGINAMFNATFMIFSVKHNRSTNGLIIQRSSNTTFALYHDFTIAWKSGSLSTRSAARILGFDPNFDSVAAILDGKPTDPTREVISSYSMQLNGYDYMMLSIVNMRAISTGETAKVVLRSSPGSIIYNGHITKNIVFSTPITKWTIMEVEFKNPDNTYVDFRGMDNSMTLDVITECT